MGKLSILGMYNYRPDIFDGLVLPTAADLNPDIEYVSPLPDLSRDDVISTICFNLAELSLIYAEPETLKAAIALWSRKNRWSWRDLWATVCFKYNPIWNKDGTITEERQIIKSGEESRSTAGSSTMTTAGSEEGQVVDSGEWDESRDKTTSGSSTMTTAGSEEGQIVDSGEWDESRDKTVSGSHNLSGTVVDDGSTTESRSTSGEVTKNEQNLHSVTGFDTDTLSPSYNDGLTGTNTSSETVSGSGTNYNTRTSQESGQTAGTEHEEAGGTNGNTRESAGTKSEESSGQTNGTEHEEAGGTSGNTRESAGTKSEESTGTTSGSEAGSHEEATAENFRRVEQGNIGVKTTQSMIVEAREIAMFNIYDVIAESFKENFCLMVY